MDIPASRTSGLWAASCESPWEPQAWGKGLGMPRWGQAEAGKDGCKHIRRRLSVGTGRHERTYDLSVCSWGQAGAGTCHHLGLQV